MNGNSDHLYNPQSFVVTGCCWFSEAALKWNREEQPSELIHLKLLFLYYFIVTFIHLFIQSFIYSFIHSSTHSFIHIIIHSFLHLLIHQSIIFNSFIRGALPQKFNQLKCQKNSFIPDS